MDSGLSPLNPTRLSILKKLRERLAIIHDEESRRDEAKHIDRLRAVSEKIDKLQAALPQPIDTTIGALSSASQLRQSAGILGRVVAALTRAEHRSVLVPASSANLEAE